MSEGTEAGPPSQPSRGSLSARGLAAAALVVVFAMAAASLIAEVGLRILHIRPKRLAYPTFWVQDGKAWVRAQGKRDLRIKIESPFPEVDMGEYVPGTRYQIRYATNPRGYFDADNAVEIDINSLGLRGPEIERVKPPGVLRILGVGDSFTHGEGVKDEDTFLRQLETRLDRAPVLDPSSGQAMPVQVLNAGVAGYNTVDEVLYLERRWLDAFDPDLILITFFLNDAYSDEAFVHAGDEMGLHLKAPEGLARMSYLWDLVQHTIRVRRVSRSVNDFYRSAYFRDARAFLADPKGKNVDWQRGRAALARAAELARDRHEKLALVVFPELVDLSSSYPFADVHAVVMDACKEIGIPAFDLLPAFLGHRASDLWVHETDHHPNEVAHRIAADAIEGFLRDPAAGLLRESPSARRSP